MTLEKYAYRIAGPVDAAINLTINSAIPALLLPWTGLIPWFGWPSAFSFVGTMVLCVGIFATYFGVRAGMMQRRLSHVRWSALAWRTGLLTGLVGYLATLCLFVVVETGWPEWQVPCAYVIVGNGLFAAALAYCFQVRGVLLAGRLGNDK